MFRLIVFCLFFLLSQSLVGQKANYINVESDPQKDLTSSIKQIDIYPNPANEYLFVQTSISLSENTEFELRSLLGTYMTVQPENLGNGKYRFQIKDFPVGYYFIIVRNEKTLFKKAIKFLKS